MLCEHCGTDNLDESLSCSMCGASLGDPATRLQEARRRRLQRYSHVSPRQMSAVRGRLAVLIGAIGAYIAVLSYGPTSGLWMILVAAVCGIVGLFFGLSAVSEMRMQEGVVWSRAVALAGSVISAGVLLIPTVIVLARFALFPVQIAREPVGINNLRRLSTAMQSYIQDYDEQLPGWITGTNGVPYHNTWDEQLSPYVKSDGAFSNGLGRGIRSPSQPPPRSRVVCYGLNGLMVTKPKDAFDGNADWPGGPYSHSVSALEDPGGTILLAEIATETTVAGGYELKALESAKPAPGDTSAWKNGLAMWIDIDPRAWVETRGPVKSYEKRNWDNNRGVGRGLHPAGACYAFADGHVAFLKLRQTVTGGQAGVPAGKYWDTGNKGNMWNPQ